MVLHQGTTSQAAEKLKMEGVGGFNPRTKPTESQVALATEGQFSAIPPKFPSFSAASSVVPKISQKTKWVPRVPRIWAPGIAQDLALSDRIGARP